MVEATLSDADSRAPRARLPVTSLVFGLFFFSGAFALVYEVAWVRALSLQFGSTSLAVSTVLTLFMGGLALGAWLAGRRADRLASPLTLYGLLELLLAGYALFTPTLFRASLPIFEWFGAEVSAEFVPLSLFRFLVSAILLLPPTTLMGATLPILSRFYVLRWPDGGLGAGLLYAVNTIGAFTGTLCVGLFLLPSLGLRDTILFCALGNLTLAGLAIASGRWAERRDRAATPAPANSKVSPEATPSLLGIGLAVAFTGFAAMASEVAWTRILVLVLGGSTYAFTVMLSTYLAGLGLGAAGVALLLRAAPASARWVFSGLALSAAFLLCFSAALSQSLPDLFRRLYFVWHLEDHPEMILTTQFALAAALMGIPALVMGGLLPAGLRVAVRDPAQTGRQVGVLYAANTCGTIVGSFAAGFVLIPQLGIRGTILVAVAAQCAGAVLAALGGPRGWRRLALAGAGLGAIPLVLWLTPAWHHQLMTSAMYQYAANHGTIGAAGLARRLAMQRELLYYRDGLTATVTVTRDRVSPDHDLYISTNGKIDGSSHYDMPNQRLAAHVPLLFHPAPSQVAVIGMGTGSTAGSAALHHDVKKVTVVEIEAAMVEGARHFRADNHALHENPKVDIRIADGRLFLRLHPETFDVIISEPSNPWLAGSSDLFTREFFRLGARGLREGGVFCQWVQLYGMSSESVRTIARTFVEVFPNAYLVSTILDADLLLMGSERPIDLDFERAAGRMRQEEVHRDLADPRVGISSIYELAARFRMGPSELLPMAGRGPLHTDDLPIVAYRAPRDLYRSTREENLRLLADHSKGIAPYLVTARANAIADGAARDRLGAEFFRELAAAYRAFLPGGREALESSRAARSLEREAARP